ncbi:metallophosphoesterase family protein [Pyxidicoccus sp. MSG2]|nr:metallophosphoesterase family protein [Pyxidicoccus sp. MSG2]
MRVAILADIHGNLPACEAVLEDITRSVAPDYIVAAGDLALRGAHPRETVDLLFDRCDSVLMGNTDCYLAGNYLGGAYRERDHWKTELLRWTRDQLGGELLQKLGALPFSVRYTPRKGQDLFVCHANPRNLEESLDPTLDDVAVRRFFNHLDAAACAFGHLHFPYRRRVGRMLIADVASAGIPRDGDLRPAYGVFTFTPKGWRVQIRRVRYPVRKARKPSPRGACPAARCSSTSWWRRATATTTRCWRPRAATPACLLRAPCSARRPAPSRATWPRRSTAGRRRKWTPAPCPRTWMAP